MKSFHGIMEALIGGIWFQYDSMKYYLNLLDNILQLFPISCTYKSTKILIRNSVFIQLENSMTRVIHAFHVDKK